MNNSAKRRQPTHHCESVECHGCDLGMLLNGSDESPDKAPKMAGPCGLEFRVTSAGLQQMPAA